MYPEDEKHTSFRTLLGVYYYTVTPFRLKNTGATYQRAMSIILCNHLRKTVDCYVDDIAIKSRDKNDHLRDLRTMFDIMRAHQLKMNLTKGIHLSWGVASFWDLLSHQREFILTQIRSKQFRACIHLRISKSLGVCKAGWPISEDSSQISRAVVNHSPSLWRKVFLSYRIKLVKKLSRLSKDTSLNP